MATATWLALCILVMICNVSLADRVLKEKESGNFAEKESQGVLKGMINFLWQSGKSSYEPVWPEMKFGWRIIVGSIIGFLGAALGSVGGVGGGGIFVPMLALIIGFDPKSSTAISKCMIMGASLSTVYYNLRLRHPTLDMPLIDYDLAMLFQPMLMLGISIGVICNVMFADWMVTVLLIILFIGTSTKATFKGIATWKKETMIKKEAARQLEVESKPGDASAEDYKPLPSGPADSHVEKVPLLKNIYWKELLLLVYIWVGFLLVQIAKGTWRIGIAPYNPLGRGFFCGKAVIESVPANSFLTFQPRFQGENFDKNKIFYSRLVKLAEKHECADVHLHNLLLHGFFIKEMMWYPSLVPIAISVALFEAICLYKGTRVIGSKGKEITSWKVHQICLYCSCGIIAGMVGGLLGLGGGFILGPVFLELGIPPEVASATSTFSMLFSSSMSVVQYYMLDRFPVPYGGVGIENMIEKMENHEYMGFENLCDHS